jgi:hypothetical protein
MPHISSYRPRRGSDRPCLREEDAERALADVLRDEPTWARLLRVASIELDEQDVSEN